jgi:hypothetical protein
MIRHTRMPWHTLRNRFGNKFQVAEAYRKRIKPGEGKELRKFSDFLNSCLNAMESTRHLAVLDNPEENRSIVRRLQTYTIDRWNRVVDGKLHQNTVEAEYPSFRDFCDFLSKEARVACSAIGQDRNKRRDQPGKKAAVPASAQSQGRMLSTNSKPPSTDQGKATPAPRPKTCVKCKELHDITGCPEIIKMSLTGREELIHNKALCWGCLRFGHRKRDCRKRLKCEGVSAHSPHPIAQVLC